jgi:prefoldin beta subunit
MPEGAYHVGKERESPRVRRASPAVVTHICDDTQDTYRRLVKMDNIPPKVQNQLAMLQQMQQQLQTIVSQKAQYEMTVRESKRAVEDLGDVAEDANVYMSVGTIMMQQSKEKVLASLNEKIETLELRIKSLEKQEKTLQGRFEQLSAQIKGALEGHQPPSAS